MTREGASLAWRLASLANYMYANMYHMYANNCVPFIMYVKMCTLDIIVLLMLFVVGCGVAQCDAHLHLYGHQYPQTRQSVQLPGHHQDHRHCYTTSTQGAYSVIPSWAIC